MKKSENDVDLSNLSHITQSTLKDLNSISVDQLERAADHILAKVPRIYIGKKPKKWCRAMSLPGWCERRKWKNVLVKEINDRIGYYQPDQQNLFFDELGQLNVDRWRLWKYEKSFSSSIMQKIYLCPGTDRYVSQLLQMNKKDPVGPPTTMLECIDQAIVNNQRYEESMEGLSSSFVHWTPATKKFTRRDLVYGIGGTLAPEEVSEDFDPKKTVAGILDLRHFPLTSSESEVDHSMTVMLKALSLRAAKMGYQNIDAWMVIHPVARKSAVRVMNESQFEGFRMRTIQYIYARGEPYSKANTRGRDLITYFEKPFIGHTGVETYFSDSIDEERVFGKPFKDPAYYRVEHRDVVYHDELRLEQYIRFISRHASRGENVLLAFAGSKPLRACRVSSFY